MATVHQLHPEASISLVELWLMLDGWQAQMQVRGIVDSVREDYEADVLRFLRRTRAPNVSGVSEADLERFLADMNPKGPRKRSYFNAFKSFFRFAAKRGLTACNPAEDLWMRPPKYGIRRGFEADQAAAIIAEARKHRDGRRAAAITLLFETGARIGSLCEVEPRDLVLGPGREAIDFRVTKGDRPYSLPLTPAALEAARALLGLMREGQRTIIGVQKYALYEWFTEAAERAGLPPGRRHPHLARHTFGTAVYRQTKDIIVTRDALNHANVATTQVYAESEEDMRSVLRENIVLG
jgi:integrase/recombinase XerD